MVYTSNSQNEMDKATTTLHLFLEGLFRIGLWVFVVWLDGRMPYVRHIDEDELWYYRYPSVDSLVPRIHMYALIVAVPFIIYFIHFVTLRKDPHTIPDIVSGIYGLTLAYCMSGLFVATLKIAVGRPRPNFYLRCFPEGYGTDIDMCDGEYHGQMDGRKGFPSAHACFAFCCMTYMVIHLYHVLDLKRPRFLKGVIIVGMSLLMLVATGIAVSRTMDYHNNYSDVIGGALIGSVFAYLCDHLYCSRDVTLQTNIRSIMKVEEVEEEEIIKEIIKEMED